MKALGGYLLLRDFRQLVGWIRLALRTIRGAGTGLLVTTWAVTLLFGLVPIGMSVAMANLVGAAPGVLRDGLDSRAGSRLVLGAFVYVTLLAGQGVVQSAAGAVIPWVTRQLDGRLRERVMRAALRPDGVQHLEDPSMRSALEQARTSAPTTGMTPGTVAAVVPRVVAGRVTLLAYLVGLTYLYWPLGLAFLLVTLKSQDEMQKGVWRVAGGRGQPPPDVAYQLELATTPAPGKEVRVFGLGDWIGGRFRTGMLSHVRDVWSRRRDFTPGLVATLVASAALTIVGLYVVGVAGATGSLGIGEVAFAVVAIMAINPGGAFNQDDMPLAFASQTIEAIEAAERVVADDSLRLGGRLPVADHPTRFVRFENVTFRYPGTDTDVLRDLDLTLHAGERLALVGLNGAGKTTLVKLLCGLYHPTSGTITIDDEIDLRDVDPVEWRRRLAVLFQEFAQYELSALDNVRYGAVDATLEEQSATGRAAARAGVDEVISRLPAGWNSPLSPGYPDGASLSGGEWQRVGLARALFAVEAGARILILDEPTASLDVRGEAELYDRLLDVTNSRDSVDLTTVLISHRFSTVRQADRIVVLAGGSITESGTHEELLEADGLYAGMFRAQAEGFVAAGEEERA